MTSIPNGPVAVLDDDVRFIRMVERILQNEQMEIQPVTTPDHDEAVRVVAQAGCTAALVDIYLYGEAAGFTLIERLRDDPATASLPLIVTSGASRELSKRLPFLRQHHCGALPKPFTPEALVQQLDEMMHAPAQAATNGHASGAIEDAAETARWRILMNPMRRLERAS